MASSVKTTTSDSPLRGTPVRHTAECIEDRFTLVQDYFPILLSVSPRRYSDNTVRQMAEAFEAHFARGERYVVISVTQNRALPPDAKQRKLVTDWINSPRVLRLSRRLCLGAANIVPNSIMRGLHTALLWAWNPPFPIKPVSSAGSALEYALDRLKLASIPLPNEEAMLRVQVERQLQDIMGVRS